MFIYAPMENINSLHIQAKGKSNEMLKYPLKGIRKRSKKAMVKYMLYPNIADLINVKMSWMKAAVSCAFKHW